MRFLPLRSASRVGKPPIDVTFSVLVSITSTAPVLPAGTQIARVRGSYVK